MKVNKSIPSSITVGGVRVEIHYRDQGISCWRCGMAHVRRECDTHHTRFVNRFSSFDDFNEEAEDESDVEENPAQPEKEAEDAGGSAGLLPSHGSNGEFIKGHDIPGEIEKKEDSKHEQEDKEPLNTKKSEESEIHEEKILNKVPVIAKETDCDDITDDEAIMKADIDQKKKP